MPCLIAETAASLAAAVSEEARRGLTAFPKTLAPWLFYDSIGSTLFEQITQLPEYYLTSSEYAIFQSHSQEIVKLASADHPLTVVEFGAGTATKTSILLAAVLQRQSTLLYQPVDVSDSALDKARDTLASLSGLTVRPLLANYTIESLNFDREPDDRILAVYIGSSMGNFVPTEAARVLSLLRAQLRPGDTLLLGTDLAPGPHKPIDYIVSAYNDGQGVTARFNRNILHRLNRDLGSDFDVDQFSHRAIWNAIESRIEMHLESAIDQTVLVPADLQNPLLELHFAKGESIHTENSYKFTEQAIESHITAAGFELTQSFRDVEQYFSVTVATAI